ncbi:hypothetical protein AZE42_11004 [Rhizopogon vesiculosus]|uniref:Uncharacterized protein n=1 Tax=Rhizopogon vesiculosus TaxID=180088 RepID=A0A1J8PRN4_9AGAM|nr:hypothetical protein AZE42_11004 [Rhizopogon vesiculosus]
MVDPTAEVRPDFAAEFYDNICTATGQPDVQIIDCLIQSWTVGHSRRVGKWNQQRDEEEQAITEAALARTAQVEEARYQQEVEAARSNSRHRRRNSR